MTEAVRSKAGLPKCRPDAACAQISGILATVRFSLHLALWTIYLGLIYLLNCFCEWIWSYFHRVETLATVRTGLSNHVRFNINLWKPVGWYIALRPLPRWQLNANSRRWNYCRDTLFSNMYASTAPQITREIPVKSHWQSFCIWDIIKTVRNARLVRFFMSS